MKWTEIFSNGIKVYHTEPYQDHRGTVQEIFNISKENLTFNPFQLNSSVTVPRGLRGIHYQIMPMQGRYLWVPYGKVFLVCIDIRQGKSFGQYYSRFLKEDEIFFAPGGFAWGFQNVGSTPCVVEYLCDAKYNKETMYRFRYDDPYWDIKWPCEPILSFDDDVNVVLFEHFIKDWNI